MKRKEVCCCAPTCEARCQPGSRLCDQPGCPCYELWSIEMELAERQTAHLSSEEIRQMAIDAWSGGSS